MKNGPYILILAPFDYPGKKYRGKYAYEHHVIWWKSMNILPPKGYQIHHRNHIKTDNRIENLELIDKITHIKLHKRKKEWNLLICGWCNNPFRKETRNFRFKSNQGQKIFYCGRSCSVKKQISLRNSQVGTAANC